MILRITPDVHPPLPLIHPHVIYQQLRREHHRRQIDCLPILYNGKQNKNKRNQVSQASDQERNDGSRHVRDSPRFMTIDMDSSGINLCPTPLPFGTLVRSNSASADAMCTFPIYHLSLGRVLRVCLVFEPYNEKRWPVNNESDFESDEEKT